MAKQRRDREEDDEKKRRNRDDKKPQHKAMIPEPPMDQLDPNCPRACADNACECEDDEEDNDEDD